MKTCGISGCKNDSVGLTEVVSIYDAVLAHSMCIEICQVHKQLMEAKRGK